VAPAPRGRTSERPESTAAASRATANPKPVIPEPTGGPVPSRAERQRSAGRPGGQAGSNAPGGSEPPYSSLAASKSSSPPLAGPSGSTLHAGRSPTTSHEASGRTRGRSAAAPAHPEQHPGAPRHGGERAPPTQEPAATPSAPARPADDPAVAAALNQQAAVLQNAFFPNSMIGALALPEEKVAVTAVRIFLARFRRDAGEPADSVERLLLDQLAFAHLRVGQLHALAEEAPQLDFKKLYLHNAARLLAEIDKTVLTLIAYRDAQKRHQRRPALAHAVAGSTEACPAGQLHPAEPGDTSDG